MDIFIKRRTNGIVTIGDMIIDSRVFCHTLEDEVRPAGEKVPGKTAIPAGRYELRLTYSQRFRRVMPQLMNVPGFSGVRIHSGNTEADTDGCILVGWQHGEQLINSRDTYNDLMDILDREHDTIYLTIK
jgi:hypothetical protein